MDIDLFTDMQNWLFRIIYLAVQGVCLQNHNDNVMAFLWRNQKELFLLQIPWSIADCYICVQVGMRDNVFYLG